MLVIRPEMKEDYAAVYETHRLAFGRENEAQLVETLRKSTNFIPELSLVVVKNGRVVGHVLFSSIVIETQIDTVPALALAPIAVLPGFQNQGIGSELIRRGLEKCQRLGHKIVVVVGHPAYYPRFGFSSARARGLEAPFQVSDEAFMALELTPKALDGIKGMVKYPLAFAEV